MCFTKNLRVCSCPPEETKLQMPTSPMDCFGFSAKCCGCVPLKSAVIIIGIVTLIWSALQIQSADKTVSNIFPEKKITYSCLKIFYVIASVLLLISCGILFLGIVMNKFYLINIFVWYAFIYNCLSVAVVATAFVFKILKIEKKVMKHTIRLILSLSWHCLFLYFLTIVNSYKILTMF